LQSFEILTKTIQHKEEEKTLHLKVRNFFVKNLLKSKNFVIKINQQLYEFKKLNKPLL